MQESMSSSSPPPPSSNSSAAPLSDRCYSNQSLTYKQQVEAFLSHCGLSQYYQTFLDEGFDRSESLLEITETDLIQMQVKRGHRRLLQRAIANARGIPASVPLNITPVLSNKEMTNYPQHFQQHYQQPVPPPPPAQPPPPPPPSAPPVSSPALASSPAPVLSSSQPSPTIIYQSTIQPLQRQRQLQKSPAIPAHLKQPSTAEGTDTMASSSYNTPNDYHPSAGTMTHNTQSGMSSTEEEAVTNDNIHRLWKRKYHRHAKPDTEAPLKPPSAYVMFSNDVRTELKEQNKSFTDLAKIIGDRWKNITPDEKEMYETIALKAREEYLKKVEEYQKTEAFKKYQQYISDFKAENEAAARPVGRPRKRHRRDGYVSDGTISDSARPQRVVSQPQGDTSNKNATDQKHYPYYLLNDEASNQASSPQQQQQQQNQFASPTLSSKK
ncbi:hypothetical protein BD560DRAFT_444707 [Blakeslea trispora]|nr:hypothetical protein BD560DRAFT_444707 [Blakeslea trispora]